MEQAIRQNNTNLRMKTFDIFIKTLYGKTITIRTDQSSTIDEIKYMIQEKEGTTFDEQKLIYAGRLLQDNLTLEQCNIKKESTLHMITKLTGD
jgi:ubiquitin